MRLAKTLWSAYVEKKQSLSDLAETYGKSHVWVRAKLDTTPRDERSGLVPCRTVIIPDTTFWGYEYGVCVFRAPHLKANLWWQEVESERMATYHYGRKILESEGWVFTAAVVDGRRGLTGVFKDIPVQLCQFHQMKQVTKYLTRRPKTEAGQALRTLTLTLARTTENVFMLGLTRWHETWHAFIEEKTVSEMLSGKRTWYYTHKNVRSAYYSLKRNLPYLFTYQKYPDLHIPNTTNSLDGMFSQLKAKTAVHRGLRKDRRYRVISKILRNAS